MNLGTLSLSLAVKEIEVSRAFYEKLGFITVGGDASQNWLIIRNNQHTIGLFQGMFEKNVITFNPGWDAQCEPLESFTDIRDIQKRLKASGVDLLEEVDESTTGAASCMLFDPDGNPILIDQHI
jgi:catechol 2,3-dioxygenase-like lactoylglutathione lyase family enzyme|tara:strand:- start:311 stop:682 length:372 start_codon:yes stop_codon:yes gene_type:complete